DAGGCGSSTCSPVATTPLPPPPPFHFVNGVQLLTVTDDGHALLRRTSTTDRGLDPHADLVALSRTGTTDWTTSLVDLAGVATSGDTVFAVGNADPGSSDDRLLAVRAATGRELWRSDGDVGGATPIAAGGLVYVDAEVFAGGGCSGPPTCPELTTI